MEDIQRLRTRQCATKFSVTKLLGKVDGILSADLEGINSQSLKKAVKLMADTTLCQLKAKQGQLVELNNAITEKIDDEIELEEDISNADACQSDLDECIAFLTEFLAKSHLLSLLMFIPCYQPHHRPRTPQLCILILSSQ